MSAADALTPENYYVRYSYATALRIAAPTAIATARYG